MKKKIISILLATMLVTSIFTGCSKAKSATKEITDHNNPIIAEDYEYGMKANTVASRKVYNGANVSNEAGASTSASTDQSKNPINDDGDDSEDIKYNPESRMLIRTVNMQVETTELDKVKSNIESNVKAQLGYIESSNISGTGKNKNLRTLSYTIRIPADKLDIFIGLVGNSCTVISSSEKATDVTMQYVDTKARVESLRVEYNQLLALLKEAKELDGIIELQNRLSEVRYQIESYESKLRVLKNQVSYSTLNLTVREVLKETEIEPAHEPTYGERVAKQFEQMLKNTKNFFEGLGLAIIACLPGIIFLGINAIIIVVIIKSAKKKRRKKINAAKINEKIIPPISFDNTIRTEGIVPVNEPEPKKEEKKEEFIKFAGDVAMNIDEKPKDIKVANIKPVTDYKEPKYAEEIQAASISEENKNEHTKVGLSGKVVIPEDKQTKDEKE